MLERGVEACACPLLPLARPGGGRERRVLGGVLDEEGAVDVLGVAGGEVMAAVRAGLGRGGDLDVAEGERGRGEGHVPRRLRRIRIRGAISGIRERREDGLDLDPKGEEGSIEDAARPSLADPEVFGDEVEGLAVEVVTDEDHPLAGRQPRDQPSEELGDERSLLGIRRLVHPIHLGLVFDRGGRTAMGVRPHPVDGGVPERVEAPVEGRVFYQRQRGDGLYLVAPDHPGRPWKAPGHHARLVEPRTHARCPSRTRPAVRRAVPAAVSR